MLYQTEAGDLSPRGVLVDEGFEDSGKLLLLTARELYTNGSTLTNVILVTAPTQNVSWTNVVGVSALGNSLTKNSADGWNAGAVSTQTIASGDGYVEFTATETNKHRRIGLSNGDTNQSWDDIDFCLYLNADGTIYINEGSNGRGTFGAYAMGDVFRVAVEGGVVKYRKNGILPYTSTVPPTYPLLVDTSLYTNGSTLTNVIINAGGSGGSSSAQLHWLVTDQLGTPRMIFDQSGSLTVTDQNGNYVSGMTRHDYLPFGEELFAGTGGRTQAQGYSGSDGVRQKFTGHQRDNETGLDYFKARYYSSTQGRFTSADAPFADQRQTDPSSWNSYAYVRNNPCNRTDPNGRCSPPPGLKQGQVGICIESFIAAKTFKTFGAGNDRTFNGNDEKLTSKFRVDIIAERMKGNSKNLTVTQKTTAGYSYAVEPLTGVQISPAVQGTANSKLNSTQGSSGAPSVSARDSDGATAIGVPIARDGTASFNVTTKAENGLADFVDFGSIRSSLNLSVNANNGKVELGEGSKATGYPSFEIYSYTYQGNKIVTNTVKLLDEGSPNALKEPMKPIP